MKAKQDTAVIPLRDLLAFNLLVCTHLEKHINKRAMTEKYAYC